MTASWARGRRRRCGPWDGAGQRCHGHGNDARCTESWAWVGQHCCRIENGVEGLGTAHAWSTASLAQVGEDGGVLRGSTVVGNDGTESPRRTR
jgi:hypothetical protein